MLGLWPSPLVLVDNLDLRARHDVSMPQLFKRSDKASSISRSPGQAKSVASYASSLLQFTVIRFPSSACREKLQAIQAVGAGVHAL